MLDRLRRALRLDAQLYAEVSSERSANGQAFVVVLLSGLSNGLGLMRRLGAFGVTAGVCAGLLGWLLWSAVILAVATLLRQRRDGRSLLRTLGFANAPGVLLIAGIIPVLGDVIRVLVVLWLLIATVVAVQAVFRVGRWRAAVISTVSFIAYLLFGIVSGHFAAS